VSPRIPSARPTRRGVALPMVLLLVTILSVLAAGAITLVTIERRVVGNEAVKTQAEAIARTGLDRFIADRPSLGFTSEPPAVAESTRIIVANGYADVVMERVREERGLAVPALFVIRSRGVRLDRARRPRPIAERTIAEYARWQRPGMQVLAGWTSLRGIAKQGSAGVMSGIDACGAAAGVAGAAVPTAPGYVQSSGSPALVGTPPLLDLGTSAQAAAAVTLDWADIASRGLGAATITLPGGSWPTATEWANPAFWPVIIVRGDWSPPTDGRGLLVVTGNLSLPASRVWDGVIIVGEQLQAVADATVNGAMLSGLNLKLGMPNAPADAVDGTVVVQYNSCHVARALASFGGLSPMRNATIDRWVY
jgi:hypothetical protein